jgi:hypothetical protein
MAISPQRVQKMDPNYEWTKKVTVHDLGYKSKMCCLTLNKLDRYICNEKSTNLKFNYEDKVHDFVQKKGYKEVESTTCYQIHDDWIPRAQYNGCYVTRYEMNEGYQAPAETGVVGVANPISTSD